MKNIIISIVLILIAFSILKWVFGWLLGLAFWAIFGLAVFGVVKAFFSGNSKN